MAAHPEKIALAHAGVAIDVSAGCVAIKFPDLFATDGGCALHSLIERLFQSPSVLSVALDHDRKAVEIRYDQGALDLRTALREFSAALSNTGPGQAASASNAGSLLRPYLDRIPGRVSFVERRRRTGGELTGTALTGNGAAASSAGLAAGTSRIATTRTGPALTIPAGSRIVVEDLIVEFDPPPEHPFIDSPDGNGAGAEVTRPGIVAAFGRRVRQSANLAAAGGCFVMSIVGVITPGIPTVPFVLATGYFLARSSPQLHERFRRSRFFGTMVSDYEDHGGLRWTTKFKIILFTVGLMAVTVVIAGAALPLLITVGIMGTIGIYVLCRIPTVNVGPRPEKAMPATA